MLDIVKKPDYQRVMKTVRGIHAEFDIKEPPVNPVTISRDKGVNVYFVEFSKEADNISGFYDFDENAIYVNRNELILPL